MASKPTFPIGGPALREYSVPLWEKANFLDRHLIKFSASFSSSCFTRNITNPPPFSAAFSFVFNVVGQTLNSNLVTLKSIRKEGSENEDLTEMALKSNASKVQLFLKFVKKIEFTQCVSLIF